MDAEGVEVLFEDVGADGFPVVRYLADFDKFFNNLDMLLDDVQVRSEEGSRQFVPAHLTQE